MLVWGSSFHVHISWFIAGHSFSYGLSTKSALICKTNFIILVKWFVSIACVDTFLLIVAFFAFVLCCLFTVIFYFFTKSIMVFSAMIILRWKILCVSIWKFEYFVHVLLILRAGFLSIILFSNPWHRCHIMATCFIKLYGL